MDDSDIDDISDEEYASIIIRARQNKVIRIRPNHFNEWNDTEFYNRFRLHKHTAQMVLNQIAPRIENKTTWNHALSAETMFLLTLRFHASGGMLIAAGDFCGVTHRFYNQSQISTRNPIERVFGVWKRRFPVLTLGLRLKLRTIQSIIVATEILHNICCDQNEFDLPPLDDFVEEQVQYTLDVETADLESTSYIGTRREAMIEYFRHLYESN